LQNLWLLPLDLCTKAQRPALTSTRPVRLKCKPSLICKSLISLNILSCPMHGHFVERLDFQGLQRIQSKFSTKLSTEFLEQCQSPDKSTTYTQFQEIS